MNHILYIFDKDEQLAAILKNDGSGTPYTDPVHTEQVNGLNIFEFSLSADNATANAVEEGGFVAFKDLDGDYQYFEIKRIEEESGPVKRCYCETAALELLDEIVTDLRPSGVSAQFALTEVLAGTRWDVGQVDNLGQNSTNFYYESAISAVQKILNTWGGEVKYRVTIQDNAITGRFVDILDRRGADRGRIFLHGKDLVQARRTIEASNIKTALFGRGKGEETESGFGRRITFADVEWSVANGDPVDKPAGQEWVGDPDALLLWGRANGTRHRYGIFEDPDITDPEELLQKTWETLQAVKEPLVTYEATVADLERVEINERYYYDTGLQYDTGLLYAEAIQALKGYTHEKVRLGDTVRVIDRTFTPALKLSARVIELRRDLIDPMRTEIILGNFIPTIAEDAERLRRVEARLHERQGVWDDKYRPGDPVETTWLDGVINVLQNELESTGGHVYITDGDGILILDQPRDQNPTKALQLKGGVFAIADSQDGAGNWNWRTFGDGTGFTADELKTGTLLASLVTILAGNYVTLDGQGLRVFDSLDELRVHLGEYEPGQFGLLVNRGEIYATAYQSGGQGATDYVRINPGDSPIEIIKDGKKALDIWTWIDSGSIQVYDVIADDMRGQIWAHDDAMGQGLRVQARTNSGSSTVLHLWGASVETTGTLFCHDGLSVSGDKNAMHQTKHHGVRYYSARESPQFRFIEEGKARLVKGECRVEINPIFLDSIEPDKEETPWFIQLTPMGPFQPYISEVGEDYFIVKTTGNAEGEFSWSLSAVREGFPDSYRTDDEDVLTSNWEDELS